MARLVPIKRHEDFIAASALVAARIPDARFLVVGDGERRAELEALVRRQGLTERVRFLGWRQDLDRIYAALDGGGGAEAGPRRLRRRPPRIRHGSALLGSHAGAQAMIVTLLTCGLPAFALSLVLALIAERVASRLGLVAHPAADHWHRAPVPLMGGVGVAVATVLGVLVASRSNPDLLVLAVAALVMAVVGLRDARLAVGLAVGTL